MTSRRGLLSLLMVAWASALYAQTPCPAGDVNQHPGAWRARPGTPAVSQFRAPAGSYSRAAADRTLDTILGLLRTAYPQVTGAMAYFDKHLSFSTPYPGLPFGYHLYVGVAGFYCTAADTLVEMGESGVYMNVDVNSFDRTSLLIHVDAPSVSTFKGRLTLNAADEFNQYVINGRRVFRLPAIAGEFRGVDQYATHYRTRPGDPPDIQWLVFRKPDGPLFTYVTRGEYVQQFRSELKTFAASQIEIDREVARLSGDSNAAGQEARSTRIMDAYLRAVDQYLAGASDEELSRPVSEPLMFFPRDPDAPEVLFREGEHVMAYLNPAYLNPQLPHHVPQFIVIQLAARTGAHPWEANFREQISGGLDFDVLEGMIGR